MDSSTCSRQVNVSKEEIADKLKSKKDLHKLLKDGCKLLEASFHRPILCSIFEQLNGLLPERTSLWGQKGLYFQIHLYNFSIEI